MAAKKTAGERAAAKRIAKLLGRSKRWQLAIEQVIRELEAKAQTYAAEVRLSDARKDSDRRRLSPRAHAWTQGAAWGHAMAADALRATLRELRR